MPFAVTNRGLLRYRLDETDGTAITTAGHMQEVPFTSEGLSQSVNTTPSESIRGRRSIDYLARPTRSVEGSIDGEVAYGWWDDLMMCALQADGSGWSSTVTAVTGTTIEAVSAGTLIRDTTTGAFASFTAGMWVKIEGFATAGNNGYAKVTAVGDHDYGASEANNELELAYIALTDESATPSVTITPSEYIKDGNKQRHVTIEREYSDLASEFARYTECEIGSMDLSIEAESMVTLSLALMGNQESSQTSTGATTQNNSPAANDPIDTGNHVPAIYEGGTATDGNTTITSLSLSVDNQMESRYAVGAPGPNHHRIGRVTATGNLSVFYDGKAELDKFLAKTATTLVAILEDAGGKAYIVELPNVEFTEGSRTIGGTDDDVMAEIAYQAIYDSTEGATVILHRIAA